MYEEFLKQIEDFMFIEDKPEKADVIFIPGNGYPQMAEKAAELYRNGFAPKILPSGRYSITAGPTYSMPTLWATKAIPQIVAARSRQREFFRGIFCEFMIKKPFVY